ncbi:MAG: HAD family phosphatase [Ectothiorhodospiraceae bacterium]|nr:HAD family phosphatase [Chromatiales bacterium]MCP5156859.1 HAD family phosphatase [Ectothiorhodospiraceae bacterium]
MSRQRIPRPAAPVAMMVTDLDGTLLDRRSRLGPEDRAALERLGTLGVLRVAATGRSLYSARRVLDEAFPVDYLAFSTGTGIVTWPEQELVIHHDLRGDPLQRAVDALIGAGLDFMLHDAVPDNHRFRFRRSGRPNADFDRRLERYRDHARPWGGEPVADVVASQLVAIEPPGPTSVLEAIRAGLPDLSVIHATSPLDHRSRWIEVYPGPVSKSQAAAWLGARHAVPRERVHAIGNDYNDTDLLDWAGQAYVVANAVEPLRARHPVVASHDRGGFAQAARAMVASLGLD